MAIFVSLLIFLPLMGALLAGFMHHIAARIASALRPAGVEHYATAQQAVRRRAWSSPASARWS